MGAPGEIKSRLRGKWRQGQAQFNKWLKETTAKLAPSPAGRRGGRPRHADKPRNPEGRDDGARASRPGPEAANKPAKDPGVLLPPPRQIENTAPPGPGPGPAEDNTVAPLRRSMPEAPTNLLEDVRELRHRSAALVRSAAVKTKESKLFSSADKRAIDEFLGHILDKLEPPPRTTCEDADAGGGVRGGSRPGSRRPGEKHPQPAVAAAPPRQPPSPAGSFPSRKQQQAAASSSPVGDLGSLFSRSRWNIPGDAGLPEDGEQRSPEPAGGTRDEDDDDEERPDRSGGMRDRDDDKGDETEQNRREEVDGGGGGGDDAERPPTRPGPKNWRCGHKSAASTSSNWSMARQRAIMDRLYGRPLSRLSCSPYFSSGSWRGGYMALD